MVNTIMKHMLIFIIGVNITISFVILTLNPTFWWGLYCVAQIIAWSVYWLHKRKKYYNVN